MPTRGGNKSALHSIGNKGILESLGQKQRFILSPSSSGQGFFKLVWLSNWLFSLLWGSSIFCLPQFPAFQLYNLPGQKKFRIRINLQMRLSCEVQCDHAFIHMKNPNCHLGFLWSLFFSIHLRYIQKGSRHVIFSCSDLWLYSELYLVRQGQIKIPAQPYVLFNSNAETMGTNRNSWMYNMAWILLLKLEEKSPCRVFNSS